MCGIAGLWAPDLGPERRRELVGRMVACLGHRGPDGVAVWSDDAVALGLSRLAIVAPDAPAHVFANESGTLHAVVNGEIYNHRALARRLGTLGHHLPAGPDTGVIVHLYEEHGTEFPLDLDGMFAIGVWDAPRRRLVLARDRAGEKPLFVTGAAGRWAFASEPAALLQLPWVSRAPDPGALARYLVHGFFAGHDSAFASIRQLPPGCLMEIDARGERSRRYWRPWDVLGLPPEHTDDAGRVRVARGHLEHAVASRVPEEMPFGVFLSGGLDSSLIAAAAAHFAPGFPTFSMKLAGDGYDESAYARLVADHLGTRHHEITMDAREGKEALDTFAAGMDQPLGDPSLLPTWLLSRFAAAHVPVVLTGEGGDELFAGYPTYLGHRHAALAERLPGFVAAGLLAAARRMRPADRHLSVPHLVERFLGTRGLTPFERHQSWFGNFAPAEARALLAPELAAGIDDRDGNAHIAGLTRELDQMGLGHIASRPTLVSYQLLDFVLTLGGGLLTKIDRCTMANGIESRAPFLNREFMEFAFALPDSTKLRGATGKWILKQVAHDLLPPRIMTRRKQGFSPPFSAWARGPLRDQVRDTLSRERVRRAGVLDPERVATVVERHITGAAESGRAVWTLLSLQLWAERWLAAAPPAAVPRAESRGRWQPAADPVSAGLLAPSSAAQ